MKIFHTEKFFVEKESETFYGIYKLYESNLITHKLTKSGAIKMCKMLQLAYNMAIEDNEDYERERYYRSTSF